MDIDQHVLNMYNTILIVYFNDRSKRIAIIGFYDKGHTEFTADGKYIGKLLTGSKQLKRVKFFQVWTNDRILKKCICI